MIRKLALSLIVLTWLIFAFPTTAFADCATDGDTSDDDVIVCTGTDSNGVDAGDGNDQITVEAGASILNFSGGVGIDAGDGDDQILLLPDSDVVVLKGTSIDAGAGDDIITVVSASPASVDAETAIDAGDGDDIIRVNDSTFPVYIATSPVDIPAILGSAVIDAGKGDDTVVLEGSTTTMVKVIDGGEGDEDEGGDTLYFNMNTDNETLFNNASTVIDTAITTGQEHGRFRWTIGTIDWRNFETVVNNLGFTGVPSAPEPGGDDGDGGDDSDPSVGVLSSDGLMTVYLDSSSGNLSFVADNGNHVASVSGSACASAVAGQVMASASDEELGVLVFVQALGNGQFSVQVYSTDDGSMLSSAVITP
jgi:hypothetical protein